jgi:signal transduction histidine kinase
MKPRSQSSSNSDLPNRGKRSSDGKKTLDPREESKTKHELEAELALYRHALQKAREEFQAFAYSVSHDLRAPLRAIEGFSKILLEDHARELSPEPQRYLRHVIASSQTLSAQIDDLLKFYRAGKHIPTKITVNADEICKEVLISFNGQVPKELTIIQHELPSVHADPVQLREIFSQLLGNALKFTSKSGEPRIEIGARAEPGAVTFYVRDNGSGFDMRHAERLFQVFQRFHNASDYPGNGVGLAIVKRLVEAQGGCVSATSETGKGSVFCFSLPQGTERVKNAPECSVNGTSPAAE